MAAAKPSGGNDKLKKLLDAAKDLAEDGSLGAGVQGFVNKLTGVVKEVGGGLNDALQADLNNSLTDRPPVKYKTVVTGFCVRCGANKATHEDGGGCGGWEAETRTEIDQ